MATGDRQTSGEESQRGSSTKLFPAERMSLESHIGSGLFARALDGINAMRLTWEVRQYLAGSILSAERREEFIGRRYELLDTAMRARAWIYIDEVFRWLYENDRQEFDRMGSYLHCRTGGMTCLTDPRLPSIAARKRPLCIEGDATIIDDVAWAQVAIADSRTESVPDLLAGYCASSTPETVWVLNGAIPFESFIHEDGLVSGEMSRVVTSGLRNACVWGELEILPMLIERCWKNRDVAAYCMLLLSREIPEYGILPKDGSPRVLNGFRKLVDDGNRSIVAWAQGGYADVFCELLPDLPERAPEESLSEFVRLSGSVDSRLFNQETITMSSRSRRTIASIGVPREREALRAFDALHGGDGVITL